MNPAFQVRLLGDFALRLGNTPINIQNITRLQSLLAYLIIHRAAPQERSHLAFQLWPDSNEVQAHANLRKLLHQLRQNVPEIEHFLQIERHYLRWQPSTPAVTWQCDILAFEEALTCAEQATQNVEQQQALHKAVDHYQGDLLPNCYDEWILPERDRLRQSYFHAASRLMVLLEQERDYNNAIKVVQQLLRHDPLQEQLYRDLMRLYTLNGDRTAALRAYHTCATVMERELATKPSESTLLMYETLMQARDSSSSPAQVALKPRGAEAPLVGRKEEWRFLQTAWRRASNGQPHMVILSGEAGIGKTRLAEEMLAWVERQGMLAAHARCYATEGQLAFAPVSSWLRSEGIQSGLATLDKVWLSEISRIVPDLLTKRADLTRPRPMNEDWQYQQFFEALARAILQKQNQQPLLLLLDDVQWCDEQTLEWLHYLLHFDEQARLLIIGTGRAEELVPGHPLLKHKATLQRENLLSEITLQALDNNEMYQLAEHVAGQKLDSSTATRLYRETEGNPLFIVEMLRADMLKQQQPLLAEPTTALPGKVQAILTTRLDQLSEQARNVANLAAVIGREFSFTVLSAACNEDEDTLVNALDDLWQRHIIREQEAETYDFSHDKLREAAYNSLSRLRRRILHRHVAEALVKVYTHNVEQASMQIATHYERAGNAEQAIPYYLKAGKTAREIYATNEAIFAFQQALKLAQTSNIHEVTIAVIYENIGDVFSAVGQYHEAQRAYEQSLLHTAAHDYVRRAKLYRGISGLAFRLSDSVAAQKWQRQAEDTLALDTHKQTEEWQLERMEQLSSKLLPLRFNMQVQEISEVIEQLRPLIEHYGTLQQKGHFLLCVGVRNMVRDRYMVDDETMGHFREALEIGEQIKNMAMIGFAHFGLGTNLLFRGELDEAEQHLVASSKIGEQTKLVALREGMIHLAFIYRKRGQVDKVRSIVEHIRAIPGNRHADLALAHLSWLGWREGDQEKARTYAEEALKIWNTGQNNPFKWSALWPLIAIAITHQQYEAAISYMRMLLEPDQQRLPALFAESLTTILKTWDAGNQEKGRQLINEILRLAREHNYV